MFSWGLGWEIPIWKLNKISCIDPSCPALQCVLKLKYLLSDPTLLLIVKINTAGTQNLTISYDFEIHRPGSKALKHLNVVFNVCQCTWREHLNRSLKVDGKIIMCFCSVIHYSSLCRHLFIFVIFWLLFGDFCEVYVWHRLYLKLVFNLATYMLMSPWFTGLLHVC